MPGMAQRPLAPFLVQVLVEDEAGRITFVSEERIAELGRTVDEAYECAHANLMAAGIDVEPLGGDLEGCLGVTGPQHHQSSWLAAPRTLAAIASVADGRVLILAPTAVNVVLVPVDNHAAVAAALDWARTTYENEPRPLSPAAYTVADGRVMPWTDPDHPSAPTAALLAALLAASEYGDQTASLQNALTDAGEDIFVAAVTAARDPQGNAFTFAVWPQEVTDELLPRVDRVAFMSGDDDMFLVPWDDVVTLTGGHMEPGSWDPPRWRVRGWPAPDVVERLRSRAIG